MANFKVILKDKRKDGTFNIKILIVHNNQNAYIKTNYYILPNQLGKQGNIKNHDNAIIFNKRIREIITEYEQKLDHIFVNTPRMTALEIKKYLISEDRTNVKINLIEYLSQHIQSLDKIYLENKKQGKSSCKTRDCYISLRNSLLKFIEPQKDVALEHVDISFLKKYQDFLQHNGLKNGIWNRMKDLRSIFNKAISEGYLKSDHYPFRRYKINTLKKQNEPWVITNDDLRKIFCTEANSEDERFARNVFILNFYLCGINVIDLYHIENGGGKIYEGRLFFDRSKTGVIHSIKIEPEIEVLLKKLAGINKYLHFQEKYSTHENFGKNINKFLKRYADFIGIPAFTLGFSRYTWATIAFNELGIQEAIIDAALGHKTSRTLAGAHYIMKSRNLCDKANREMIDYLNKLSN